MAIVKKTKKSGADASRSTPKKQKATAPQKADTDKDSGAGGGDDDDGNGRSTSLGLEVDGEVLEFIEALDRFRKTNNRPFPSWSEVLHVLKDLGYKKG